MDRNDRSLEDRLVRLGTETEAVAPRADFTLRVMDRILSTPHTGLYEDWSLQLVRSWRIGVGVTMFAAAVCLLTAWSSSNSADQEEALVYGMSEAFE